MPDSLSADSADAADTVAGSLSADSADAVAAVPDGVTLAELVSGLPLNRSTVFEVIKALGITTTRGPGPGGRGRVAWLSSADAQRVTDAARAVHRREVRIADLAQSRPSLPTAPVAPGSPLAVPAESGDRDDTARLLTRLRAGEVALSTGLPLTTAEVALILGVRPTGASVTRGRIQAVRAGFNCWVLQSADSGDADG